MAPATRRHMVNHFEALCVAVQFWPNKAISRAQLPLLLAKVDGDIFAQLLFEASAPAVVRVSAE